MGGCPGVSGLNRRRTGRLPARQCPAAARTKAIVRATTHYNEPQVVAECSEDLGEAMRGIDVAKLDQKELLRRRGW